MKKITTHALLLFVVPVLLCTHAFGQGVLQAMKPATIQQPNLGAWDAAMPPSDISIPKGVKKPGHSLKVPKKSINYTSFTEAKINKSAEAIAANAGYEHHPELGMLFPGAPCEQCYELIGERTETTKSFVKEGIVNGHKQKMTQTSTQPMHNKDADGNWRTIITHLQADAQDKGVYTISEEATPVVINTHKENNFSALGKKGSSIKFNHNLELVYVQPDGKEVMLGKANYTHQTAGDQGMYVTNAWPGVDIEMNVLRAAIKTNFHINHAMPEYANGKLLVRDHLELDKGLSLYTEGKTQFAGEMQINNKLGTTMYGIGAATVYEEHDMPNTTQPLEYYIGENNTVDIALPGNYLSKPAASYPIIIDPLVSLATSVPVTGSTYFSGFTPLTATTGCAYLNPANTPANCTVTDIKFTFQYTTVAPMDMEYGSFDFYLGTCRSPGTLAVGYVWTCGPPAGVAVGSCGDTTAQSIYSDVATCIPAPSCTSIPLDVTMYFFQQYHTTPACSSTWCYGSAPLVITVYGETVALTAAGVTTSAATICAGNSTTLTANGQYGVPPYTYSWTPGPSTGSPVTVSPATTTVYTVTITDACGITATGTKTITVNPLSPITGDLAACIGNTSALADATAGGTWSSGAAAVATIGSATGIAGGISAGTAPITYTAAGGCKAYATFTVTPLPVGITGTTLMCQYASTTLSDATTGGSWSSNNTSVASVVATSGIVTGVSAGTDIITYGNPGCIATITVTVNPTPVISDTASTNPTFCNGNDGTITLEGLTALATYIVNYTAPSGAITVTLNADGAGNVTITGLSAGTYSGFTVINTSGCQSNSVGSFVIFSPGIPATPVPTNSSPVCAGSIVNLSATDATSSPTYLWTGPGGFTSTLQNPVINGAALSAGGTYTLTVSALGCISSPATTTVTINPVPSITLTSFTDPTVCLGTDGTLTINVAGVAADTTYGVTYFDSSTAESASITSDGSGNVVITGLSAGNYSGIYVTTPAGCVSNIASTATLKDPAPPPVPVLTSNTPICVGQTLDLAASDNTQGGIYTWTFPNGTTTTVQNPSIANTTFGDTGVYVVTYNIANCISTATEDIPLYPPIVLTNLTPTSVINYGASVALNADGALYYLWSPDNGTLSNNNINDPMATPLITTVYTVTGSSLYGCKDSAEVTIVVDTATSVIITNAFTPNNDGLNDVFRIGNVKYEQLQDFSVYNRWGQLVYHNSYDITKGWDGTFNGVPQDVGVYNYVVILSYPNGATKAFKGDVTLIR